MKHFLLLSIGFFLHNFCLSQDCNSFIQYYVTSYELGLGIVQGNPSGSNVSNPLVEWTSSSISPSGDTSICVSNCITLSPGFEWIPTAKVRIPNLAVDTFIVAFKTDYFGSAGQRGGISGEPTEWTASYFPNDLSGCIDPLMESYPDMYFENNIALIKRGLCLYDDKAQRAQDAGAEAVLVYSFENATLPLVYMAGDNDGLFIDCWFTTFEQGQGMIEQIDLNQDVFVELRDVKLIDANYTLNGAPFNSGNHVGASVITNEPGTYQLADFTVDLGCGPIFITTSDQVNVSIGTQPSCGGNTACFTGLNNIEFTNSINVFPNPTSNQLNIKMVESLESTLILYSLSGQKVIETKLDNDQNDHVLDLKELSSGTFLLKIIQGENIGFKRIQVVH